MSTNMKWLWRPHQASGPQLTEQYWSNIRTSVHFTTRPKKKQQCALCGFEKNIKPDETGGVFSDWAAHIKHTASVLCSLRWERCDGLFSRQGWAKMYCGSWSIYWRVWSTVRNRAGELVMFCLLWAKVCAYGPHFFFFWTGRSGGSFAEKCLF